MALTPTGFWSYTRSDDEASLDRLSRLRKVLADELQILIGRDPRVKLFQDAQAIPYGTDWRKEIDKALAGSFFLIPIVTPAFLHSKACCEEVMAFREREQDLGRNDLIFPFHYIDISHMEPHEAYDPKALELLKSRQRFDFDHLRHRDFTSTEVLETLAKLARGIRDALRRGPDPIHRPHHRAWAVLQ